MAPKNQNKPPLRTLSALPSDVSFLQNSFLLYISSSVCTLIMLISSDCVVEIDEFHISVHFRTHFVILPFNVFAFFAVEFHFLYWVFLVLMFMVKIS